MHTHAQVLQGPLLTFMMLFLLFIGTFVITMITIYPDHPAAGGTLPHLPQVPCTLHPAARGTLQHLPQALELDPTL